MLDNASSTSSTQELENFPACTFYASDVVEVHVCPFQCLTTELPGMEILPPAPDGWAPQPHSRVSRVLSLPTTSSNQPKGLFLVSWGSVTHRPCYCFRFFSVFPGETLLEPATTARNVQSEESVSLNGSNVPGMALSVAAPTEHGPTG